MLSPKRVKHRKTHKGQDARHGSTEGARSPSASSGYKTMEPSWITNRQIEAARVAMTRHIKRGGKVWIRIFPDKPITSRSLLRRGWARGRVIRSSWVAVVKPGRIMFELEGVTEEQSLSERWSWRRPSCRWQDPLRRS